MGEAMKAIFTEDEIKRITETMRNGAKNIAVDVHGLDVKKARRLIRNIAAIDRDGADIRVIHGYNRGTAIKSMIASGGLGIDRIAGMTSPPENPGVTILEMLAA